MADDYDKTRGLNLRNIPGLAAMLREERWIDWWRQPIKRKDGKPGFRKVPRIPGTLENARSNDLTGARGYDVARAAALADKGLAGVGWMMLDDLGRVAIDIDHCRDPVTGKIDGWAERLLAECPGAYREITPSGTGIRIIGRLIGPGGALEAFQGVVDAGTRVKALDPVKDAKEIVWWGGGIQRGAQVEIFHACARFITMTGWSGEGDCEADISKAVEWLMERVNKKTSKGRAEANDDRLSLIGNIEDVAAALEIIPNDRLPFEGGWMPMWLATLNSKNGSEAGYEAF